MIQARRIADGPAPPVERDATTFASYLEDASGAGPGSAAGLVRIESEAAAAAFLRSTSGLGVRVLAQAGRSSLTGGAIPHGETVLSVEALADSGPLLRSGGGASQSWGPGVRLSALQAAVRARGFDYPPVPTYREAMLGGTVATNAGGAATFKYGATRDWVRGLRVLLFNGDLITIERGEALARRGEAFHLRLSDGTDVRVPTPDYGLPELPKVSAGYFASDPLDLVDLFVGSEGTLGLITGIDVRLIPAPAGELLGLVFLEDTPAALRLAAVLRDAARKSDGPDVRSMEWVDRAALDLLRAPGCGPLRLTPPAEAGSALLFETELPAALTQERLVERFGSFVGPRRGESSDALERLFRLLDGHTAIDGVELAVAECSERWRALAELREAVPQRVGELLSCRRASDPAVQKIGGDLSVPFEELEAMIEIYEAGFRRRGLEYAIWGHLGDGNLHPNALPRSASEVRSGFEALLEFGTEAAERGGCPLSEHGVGRHPIKQMLLRRFLGEAAVTSMRRIKRALDPECRFAPGVIFPTV